MGEQLSVSQFIVCLCQGFPAQFSGEGDATLARVEVNNTLRRKD
jgi:hypothetical protein